MRLIIAVSCNQTEILIIAFLTVLAFKAIVAEVTAIITEANADSHTACHTSSL